MGSQKYYLITICYQSTHEYGNMTLFQTWAIDDNPIAYFMSFLDKVKDNKQLSLSLTGQNEIDKEQYLMLEETLNKRNVEYSEYLVNFSEKIYNLI